MNKAQMWLTEPLKADVASALQRLAKTEDICHIAVMPICLKVKPPLPDYSMGYANWCQLTDRLGLIHYLNQLRATTRDCPYQKSRFT
ncbi:hypothetical protein PN36_29945 [Candidatus Thiomargarita nelsonii]|uniref:Uncharacterized protein n=1 Tax=Candidatus Thiomargarita nelsonii TaxID=1003181 RepID=A0A4E0QXA5_9GAMM|nr:hypothetical protein PN36_29945 [Candidatus Thiomargarita nelsonii]